MNHLVNEHAPLLVNEELGRGIWLMTVEAPAIAAGARPGQFVHVRIPGMDDHILRRPLGIYAADAAAGTVDMMYQVLGFGTSRMTELAPGAAAVELIGPVGRGWQPPEDARRALLVAGGVGSAPLHPLACELAAAGADVTAVLGAGTAEALVARERFCAALGREPLCSTDDGTYGRAGFCTPLVAEALEEAAAEGRPFDYVACCGPEPLMRLVAGLAAEARVFCEVSLERRMACGVGACLSCVVDTVDGKRRACVDGPVFPAEEVVW
ncbi:dihydroorotate dehydrogenase electron transfer subunit [Adlercreutzia faecimuris]|uniref:Dihydroorotate dehydrogenase electron transfer subunit n=1 Tax=Adlercreutzia faecimuris TaxID=2897341 RepID=A0ABS9WGJ3_9ACTN|nr:dihydroorotate dehydrogenase electron transfer subunit [Adlercreutzia sp. JBNU-10]